MFTGVFIDSIAIAPYVEGSESELIWNIAIQPPYTSPNILSELSYKEIKEDGSGLKLSYLKTVDDVWAFYIAGDYFSSSIRSGKNQDSDYILDNRQGEFSRSYSEITDDGSKRKSMEVGIKSHWFKEDSEGHYVSVLAGYQYHDINLTVTNGVQIIPEELNGYVIEGLNSTYDSEFASKYLAFVTEHRFRWGIVGLRYEKHDLEFDSKANWNLRDDFQHPVSFEHDGDGEGRVLTLGYAFKFTEFFDVFVDLTRREYEVVDGNDVTYFSDGYVGETRLNKLNYTSNSVKAGIRIVF